MKMNQKDDFRLVKGFSLVEVTIAMAIAALASITLLGMIPSGMQTMRDAGDQAIMGRINQRILSEIQLTPFGVKGNETTLIDSFDGKERFYDDQGEEMKIGSPLTEAQIRDDLLHVYSAKIHIPSPGGGTMPKSVGGSNYAGVKLGSTPDPNLRTVVIEVAAVGGRDSSRSHFEWSEDKNLSLIKTYQTIVVKTGQDFTKP